MRLSVRYRPRKGLREATGSPVAWSARVVRRPVPKPELTWLSSGFDCAERRRHKFVDGERIGAAETRAHPAQTHFTTAGTSVIPSANSEGFHGEGDSALPNTSTCVETLRESLPPAFVGETSFTRRDANRPPRIAILAQTESLARHRHE